MVIKFEDDDGKIYYKIFDDYSKYLKEKSKYEKSLS